MDQQQSHAFFQITKNIFLQKPYKIVVLLIIFYIFYLSEVFISYFLNIPRNDFFKKFLLINLSNKSCQEKNC